MEENSICLLPWLLVKLLCHPSSAGDRIYRNRPIKRKVRSGQLYELKNNENFTWQRLLRLQIENHLFHYEYLLDCRRSFRSICANKRLIGSKPSLHEVHWMKVHSWEAEEAYIIKKREELLLFLLWKPSNFTSILPCRWEQRKYSFQQEMVPIKIKFVGIEEQFQVP